MNISILLKGDFFTILEKIKLPTFTILQPTEVLDTSTSLIPRKFDVALPNWPNLRNVCYKNGKKSKHEKRGEVCDILLMFQKSEKNCWDVLHFFPPTPEPAL